MQIIYKIIFGCKSTTLTEKIDIYKNLQKKTKGTIKKELEKKIMKKNDQIIFLNYILDKENIINEQSDVILFLYNILNQSEPKQKSININDSDLEFINNKDANKALKILSKLNLSLNKIHIENCYLNYNDINFLLNLFTDELIELNLANNNFLDTNIFNKGGIYTNLQYFNLSCNNIENIDSLFTLDFPNLKELDLSNNKISDIKSISFKKCEKFQKLNLIGNMISKCLDEAANEFNKLSGLSLEYLNIEKIMLEYENISKEKKVFFEYIIDGNINDFLANISFQNISKLELKGFINVDFLSNKSLKGLQSLDLTKCAIKNISVFEKISFNEIDKIYFKPSSCLEKGLNGFDKLNKIKSVKVKLDFLNNKYKCEIESDVLKTYFLFDDFDFIQSEFLKKVEYLEISKNIDINDNEFLKYENFKKCSLPLNQNTKAIKVELEYKKDKNNYLCKIDFNNPNVSFEYVLNDLNAIQNEDIFNEVKKISIRDAIINNNNNFSSCSIFNKIEYIDLDENYIQTYQFFKDLIQLLKSKKISIHSYSNICDPSLFQYLNNEDFQINKIIKKDDEEIIKIDYSKPFYFSINIKCDIDQLNKFNNLEYCKEIHLSMELKDKDINFIKNNKLHNLEALYLGKSYITDIGFLSAIISQKDHALKWCNLSSNKINQGIDLIKDYLKNIEVKFLSIWTHLTQQIKVESGDINFRYNNNNLYFNYYFENNKNSYDIFNHFNVNRIIKLDLSYTFIEDLIPLCLNEDLTNLESLNLRGNDSIINLYELKNSKFLGLFELILSKMEIKDLNSIGLYEYPFQKLKTLDLSDNKIEEFNNIKNIRSLFPKLNDLNLNNNLIGADATIYEELKKIGVTIYLSKLES